MYSPKVAANCADDTDLNLRHPCNSRLFPSRPSLEDPVEWCFRSAAEVREAASGEHFGQFLVGRDRSERDWTGSQGVRHAAEDRSARVDAADRIEIVFELRACHGFYEHDNSVGFQCFPGALAC